MVALDFSWDMDIVEQKKRCTSHKQHPLYISGTQISISAQTSHRILLDLKTRSLRGEYCNTFTSRNTHSIFADIIHAEIFEPNLSSSIPAPLHIFACFHMILTLTRTFSPCSMCFPLTLPPITSFNNSRSYCVYLSLILLY